MRLSCFEYGIDMFWEENHINILTVESQNTYAELMNRLLMQIAGEDGGWQFSEGDKDLPMSKNVTLVHSPFLMELNSKKNLTYLYKEMRAVSQEFCGDKLGIVNSVIVDYLDMLADRMSYPIEFNIDIDAVDLFKMYDVHFDLQEADLLERVINYIQLEKTLCDTKLLIFVNLKSFFDKDQMQEIYKTAFYNKISILLLETTERDCMEEERWYIIDEDNCLIEH